MSNDAPDDDRRDPDGDRPDDEAPSSGDPESPGRSLLDDDDEIVEPNEPA